MHNPLLYSVLFGLLLGACAEVQAIATANNTISAQSPVHEGYTLNWDYIYKYKNASSVAVDHYWILTAAHVGDDGDSGSLLVGGETYTQQEVVFHPTADLALVRYDKAFPGYYGLHAEEIHNGKNGGARVYDELIMSGYGRTGTVTQITFENGPGGNGTKRWGTNEGTGTETTINTDVGDSSGNVSTLCFLLDFDLSDTDYEAGATQHDSGGPIFIERNGVWSLTGISLYLSGSSPAYSGNYAAMIHDYINWIKSVITDYDTDMDGLPDWWELEHGVTDPEGHGDSDGFTNYEEWLADTDPKDGTSFLEILDYSTDAQLVFRSSTNRTYQVEHKDDLASPAVWQANVSWFPGSYPQTERAVSTSPSNRFYRVRVKLH